MHHTIDKTLKPCQELFSVPDTSVFSMTWDKSCRLWVPVSPSPTVDSNYQVLGHRLPLALNEQNTLSGVHPQVKITHCSITTSNEWTTKWSFRMACHLKHWSCDRPMIQWSTGVPALWWRHHVGTETARPQPRAQMCSSIWKEDSTHIKAQNEDSASIWMASTYLTHRNKQG